MNRKQFRPTGEVLYEPQNEIGEAEIHMQIQHHKRSIKLTCLSGENMRADMLRERIRGVVNVRKSAVRAIYIYPMPLLILNARQIMLMTALCLI